MILEGTSGHSQGHEMWMILNFIVFNCTSELSFLFLTLPLLQKTLFVQLSTGLRKALRAQAAPSGGLGGAGPAAVTTFLLITPWSRPPFHSPHFPLIFLSRVCNDCPSSRHLAAYLLHYCMTGP